MKQREPYILKAKEVQSLIVGLNIHGPEKTYEQMKLRATQAMGKANDIDEMFLDMSESLLKKARKVEVKEENNLQDKIFYYTLSYMLRRLAHEINRSYIKIGKERYSERFIRLISNNLESPVIEW